MRKKVEELPFSNEVKTLVALLSHEKTTDTTRKQIISDYYQKIAANPKAAIIKCMDRCNNLTTMSWGLSRDRIYRQIKETEEY